eukprot:CAMPEP_0174371930 /NCGR_PEP_ID=MMETSP0811_2-20130205/101602_2 /TAXON_ID=73025 ORGANISM="Eutreptiella gymnastica-like, Strain CCMP1594" /NCGR_SAMPLE_ID=MMETSP0811_2 /ASSEMBLY_ACC=CAM_ASM_000667 /LENGTH=83 /DNA_ID=CAMNT_0015518801 /DNA_START=167 /DNA_END=414 /DNA_ORIENTATION=-
MRRVGRGRCAIRSRSLTNVRPTKAQDLESCGAPLADAASSQTSQKHDPPCGAGRFVSIGVQEHVETGASNCIMALRAHFIPPP